MYYNLPYACTTIKCSNIQFRLIISLKVTPASTLHSRVKDSINHISITIFSSNFKGGLFYINVKYAYTMLWKTII